MRDEVGARERLAGWARYNGATGHLGVRRLRGAWLGWVCPQPTEDPTTGTGLRLVLHDADDAVDSWPAWPLAEIARRWGAATRDDRFPPFVQAVLDASGWFPGRRLDDEVLDAFAADIATVPGLDPPLVLHAAARAALAELGGLDLRPPHGSPLALAPVHGHRWEGHLVDVLTEVHGQRVCLVGATADVELVMAEAGWVLATTTGDFYRAGVDLDAAVTALLTLRGPLPEVVFDG